LPPFSDSFLGVGGAKPLKVTGVVEKKQSLKNG